MSIEALKSTAKLCNDFLELADIIWNDLDTIVRQTAFRERTWPLEQSARNSILSLSDRISLKDGCGIENGRLAAEVLFASYDQGASADAQQVQEGIAQVLAEYPLSVVAMLMDPVRGVAAWEVAPPTREVIEAWIDELTLRILLAANAIRRVTAGPRPR